MKAIGEGELRQLQKENGAALIAYFVRRVEPAEDAAVLLNEVLLVMWRRAAFAPTDPTARRMWMFGIARKLVLAHHRGRGRQVALVERLRAELSEHSTPAVSDEIMAVRDAVARLPKMQRELVRLIHWDGFSLVEAAQVTGVSPSTARSRYLLARRRLANNLAADDPESEPTALDATSPTSFATGDNLQSRVSGQGC